MIAWEEWGERRWAASEDEDEDLGDTGLARADRAGHDYKLVLLVHREGDAHKGVLLSRAGPGE